MMIASAPATAEMNGLPSIRNSESSPTIMEPSSKRRKLVGREFYESIGSPKKVLAPMVGQSDFVRSKRQIVEDCRLTTRTGMANAHTVFPPS